MPNFAMAFGIDWSEIPEGAIKTHMLESFCVNSSKLAQNAVGTFHLQDQCVTTPKIAIEAVTKTRLKFSSGSWAITLEPETSSSYDLPVCTHIPGQGVSRNVVKIWHEAPPVYEERNRIFGWNFNSSTEEYWTGEYLYHSDSEQEIGIHIGKNGKVVGVEVYEKEFGPGLKMWDRDGKEIPLDQYLIAADDWPEIFEERVCKKRARELFKMEKELKKRMKKRESHGTEKTD